MNELLKTLSEWRVSGVFTNQDRNDLIQETAADIQSVVELDNVVYLHSKQTSNTPLVRSGFFLEDMSTKRSSNYLQVATLVTDRTLLIIDDVETIRYYPQSMTRNIINHIAPLTRYKITAGGALVTKKLDDLYAQFAVLDKRILYANHYWSFIEAHREVSVFDGQTIMENKNVEYLAAKLKPYIYFDLDPENEVQAALYTAIRAAPFLDRRQDISDLRLL